MFGRKKEKRRKTPMTPAEMTKLEEVGIRRGLFGKRWITSNLDSLTDWLPVLCYGKDLIC